MRTLHGLFKLHLVTQENQVFSAPGHGHGIGQRHLARLINEQKIENTLPLGPAKKPGRTAHNTTVVGGMGISGNFHMAQTGIGRKQRTFRLVPNFYAQ